LKINAFFIEDAAFIDGHLISPTLNLDESVRFLIDTGASHTVILDKDALRLGIDHKLLTRYHRDFSGIGGTVETFIIKNISLILKSEDQLVFKLSIPIFVLRHPLHKLSHQERIRILRLPSILGRDVINRLKLTFNFPRKQVFFES